MLDDSSSVHPLDRPGGMTSTFASTSPVIRTIPQVVTLNREPRTQSTPEFATTGTVDNANSELGDDGADADTSVITMPRAASLPLGHRPSSLVATGPHTSWIPSSGQPHSLMATGPHTSLGSSTAVPRHGSTTHLSVPSGRATPSPSPSPAADDYRSLSSLVTMGSAGNMLMASATTLYSSPSAGVSTKGSHSAYKYGATLTENPISLYHHEFANDSGDDLHTLDPDGTKDRNHGISWVGALDLGGLVLLTMACIMLFAGYSIYTHYTAHGDFIRLSTGRMGGTNQTGQIPNLPLHALVDQDTPSSAYTWCNSEGQQFNLFFRMNSMKKAVPFGLGTM